MTTSVKRGRILMLTSNFPRWKDDSTTPFVLHTAVDLQARGWIVDVLAPHTEGAARHESIDGVEVDRFRYLWPAGAQTVCYGGGALVNLRSSKANLAKVPALVAAEWASARRRIATGCYDLVHSHWILPQGFVGAFLGRRVPHVLTVHGGDIFGLQGGMLAKAKRLALTRASAVTANSSVTEAAVRDLAPGVARLARIPTGATVDAVADADEVAKLRARHRRGDGPLVGFLGRVVEEKGYEDFLHAVARLRGRHPGISAVVIGEGQHRRAAEELSVSLGLGDCVEFLGWVNPESVPAHLQALDVFIAPSRRGPDGWIEAQGLTVIEALANGVPVVAARCGGIVDSIDHGDNGLLVDMRAPGQIADAVSRILDEPALAQQFRTRGPLVARERFSRDAAADAFDDLFAEVMHGQRVGARTEPAR